MRYIFRLVVVCIMALSACTNIKSGTHTQVSTLNAFDLNTYRDQQKFCAKVTQRKLESCTKRGGNFIKQGRAQCYTCTIGYADAGKLCSSSSDCMGGCFHYGKPLVVGMKNQTGVCARNNIAFGCRQRIEKGMAKQAMICID